MKNLNSTIKFTYKAMKPCIRDMRNWTREMDQWLRALVALSKDLGLASSIYNFSFKDPTPFLVFTGTCTHMVQYIYSLTHTYTHNFF